MTDLLTFCAHWIHVFQFAMTLCWYGMIISASLLVVFAAWEWADRMRQ